MKIVLADDAALLREGLASLLEAAGHEVVAQVADADALRACVASLAQDSSLPDIVITDVRMPPTGSDDGLKAAIDLRLTHPGLPIMVLSAYVAGPYLGELLRGGGNNGAVGYLLKERVGRVADFLASLEAVRAGGVVVDPDVLASLLPGSAAPATESAKNTASMRGSVDAPRPASSTGELEDSRRLARLTPREQEVLSLMAQGLSNGEIAEHLVLSDGAVAKHVAGIFTKLDLPASQDNRRVRAVLTWLKARA